MDSVMGVYYREMGGRPQRGKVRVEAAPNFGAEGAEILQNSVFDQKMTVFGQNQQI